MARLFRFAVAVLFTLPGCATAAGPDGDAEVDDPNGTGGNGAGPADGGSSSDGGTTSDGGSTAAGGQNSGGIADTGGSNSGGSGFGDGGTFSDGGSPSDGGAPSAGGATSGGAPGAGGSVVTGGDECAVPALLEDHFIPSGYMGDIAQVADGACDVARTSGAQGVCHRFNITTGGAQGWSGVAWQHPLNNWGDFPGCDFSDGASLTFVARGAVGGEVVTFGASEINDPNNTLTTQWVTYTIDLGASSVAGDMPLGFLFSIVNTSAATIYIDDLRLIP